MINIGIHLFNKSFIRSFRNRAATWYRSQISMSELPIQASCRGARRPCETFEGFDPDFSFQYHKLRGCYRFTIIKQPSARYDFAVPHVRLQSIKVSCGSIRNTTVALIYIFSSQIRVTGHVLIELKCSTNKSSPCSCMGPIIWKGGAQR